MSLHSGTQVEHNSLAIRILLAFNFPQVYYLGKPPLMHPTWEGCHGPTNQRIVMLVASLIWLTPCE